LKQFVCFEYKGWFHVDELLSDVACYTSNCYR
jgi:hypothetical protein